MVLIPQMLKKMQGAFEEGYLPQGRGGVSHMAGKGQQAISRKIAHLVSDEGKTPKQAAGQAYGMARGGYIGESAKRYASIGKKLRKRK